MVKLYFTILILLSSYLATTAQKYDIQFSLSKDTVQLGEPFEAFLSISYPKGKQILFPDSNFNFDPATYLTKTFSQTQSNDTTSKDVAIYTLTAFELESPQYIQLPLYLLAKNDTLVLKTDSLPLHIKEVIETLPNQLDLIDNTTVFTLKKETNYPLIILVISGAILIIAVLLLITFKPVLRTIRENRLKKMHANFITSFDQALSDLSTKPELAEQVIGKWKEHISKLTKQPFDSYSTTEIYKRTKDEALRSNLRLFDQLIYSNTKTVSVASTKETLLAFAENKYVERINQLKQNGGKK